MWRACGGLAVQLSSPWAAACWQAVMLAAVAMKRDDCLQVSGEAQYTGDLQLGGEQMPCSVAEAKHLLCQWLMVLHQASNAEQSDVLP